MTIRKRILLTSTAAVLGPGLIMALGLEAGVRTLVVGTESARLHSFATYQADSLSGAIQEHLTALRLLAQSVRLVSHVEELQISAVGDGSVRASEVLKDLAAQTFPGDVLQIYSRSGELLASSSMESQRSQSVVEFSQSGEMPGARILSISEVDQAVEMVVEIPRNDSTIVGFLALRCGTVELLRNNNPERSLWSSARSYLIQDSTLSKGPIRLLSIPSDGQNRDSNPLSSSLESFIRGAAGVSQRRYSDTVTDADETPIVAELVAVPELSRSLLVTIHQAELLALSELVFKRSLAILTICGLLVLLLTILVARRITRPLDLLMVGVREVE